MVSRRDVRTVVAAKILRCRSMRKLAFVRILRQKLRDVLILIVSLTIAKALLIKPSRRMKDVNYRFLLDGRHIVLLLTLSPSLISSPLREVSLMAWFITV